MGAPNLTTMLGLGSKPADRETAISRKYIYAPWIGSAAYLHTIYKPADDAALVQNSNELSIPHIWQDFLRVQNGAHIYHVVSILGAIDPRQPMRRTPDDAGPFRIISSNREAKLSPTGEWLEIGVYSYSGARVLLHRLNHSVKAVDRPVKKDLASWADIDTWLRSELDRLSVLFNPEGRLLVDERLTEPSSDADV